MICGVNNMLFSIIIPAYNVEKYLKEVVDSVLSQSFSRFEVLIVDDGSDEPCRKLCDIISKSDDRIKVFHKENGGVSSARNLGIKNSKGSYIYFLDGDDRMVEDTLFKVSEILSNSKPDIVTSNTHRFTDWEKTYFRDKDLERVRNKSLEELKFKLGTDVYVSHNFYSRDFITECEPFNEKVRVSEDVYWLFNNMSKVKSVEVLDTAFYYHFEGRPGSLINDYKDSYYVSTLFLFKQMYDRIDDLNYDKKKARRFIAAIYWNYLADIAVKCKNKVILSECIDIFKKNLYIVKGDHCPIVSRLLFLRYIIGNKLFLRFLHFLLQLKNSLNS